MFREKIKVLDCTIRDGGLINNHDFDERFVREVYKAIAASGVDYMEIGYKNSKNLFSPKEFGAWKFCDDEVIRKIGPIWFWERYTGPEETAILRRGSGQARQETRQVLDARFYCTCSKIGITWQLLSLVRLLRASRFHLGLALQLPPVKKKSDLIPTPQ